MILTALVLAFGTAITALGLADGPRLSGWLLLGVLLLADGVVRLLSLGRSGWFMAVACAGVLSVVALSSATLSWSRGRDRAPERDGGITDIAAFFGAPIQDLIVLNRLPADGRILAGQELLIPRGP